MNKIQIRDLYQSLCQHCWFFLPKIKYVLTQFYIQVVNPIMKFYIVASQEILGKQHIRIKIIYI